MNGRDMLGALLDAGSFTPLHVDARLLTGFGAVGARPVCCAALGDLSNAAALAELFGFALSVGAPVVLALRPVGAGDEAANDRASYPVYHAMARLSGVSPMIALIGQGERDAGMQALCALCDIRVHIGEPAPDDSRDCCDLSAAEALEAVEAARTLLSLLPLNCAEDAPLLDAHDELNRATLLRPGMPLQDAARELADIGCALALGGSAYLCRVGGRVCGVLCQDAAGRLDGCARFIRLCDCYSIPLLALYDQCPGEPGAGAAYAWAVATVPKIGMPAQAQDGPCAPLFDLRCALQPHESCRQRLILALEALASKRDTLPPRKHGNMPL